MHEHGAIYGRGIGLQGFAYAIPTKDARLAILPLEVIATHVAEFLRYAHEHRELTFNVTPIGCGLAGYRPAQIAPFFRDAPSNCDLPPEFAAVLNVATSTRTVDVGEGRARDRGRASRDPER